MCGLIHSSVGRALHWYHGGHRFESRWITDFFKLLLSNCLNWKIYCDDHSSLWSSLLLLSTQIATVAHICKHNKQFLKHNKHFLKHNTIFLKHNTKLSKHNTKLSKHNTNSRNTTQNCRNTTQNCRDTTQNCWNTAQSYRNNTKYRRVAQVSLGTRAWKQGGYPIWR